jgi:hypothetical protein
MTSGKAENIKWGACVSWSLENHLLFPKQFRTEAFQLLCLHHKKCLGDIPKPVVLLILSLLSGNYNLNPFEEFPHPNPESVADTLKEMEENGEDDTFKDW